MDQIRLPTQVSRQTVSQEWRTILPVEASIGTQQRRVQIVIPAAPDIMVFVNHGTGIPVEQGGDGVPRVNAEHLNNPKFKPEDLGLDRWYKGAQMSPGAQITFMLMPHQDILAAAKTGLGHLGLIVEYV